MPPISLLGPQRKAITVTDELDHLGIEGRIAVITAGWQEREAEDDELQEAIGGRAINLRLHARVERIFAEDRDFFVAHRARQDRLRQLQELYQVRLAAYLTAAQELFRRPGDEALLRPEREAAVRAVQALDEHHLARIAEVHATFASETQPLQRPAVQRELQEVEAILARCGGIAIAGGHVATLLTRIRLLCLEAQLRAKPIVAWSAGAMVLTDRVVVFHDRPPEGPGNAEVLDVGLGLAPQIVALPHATVRMDLADMARIALFSQRFAPSYCVALDPYSRARWDGHQWHLPEGTWCLDASGKLAALEVAEHASR